MINSKKMKFEYGKKSVQPAYLLCFSNPFISIFQFFTAAVYRPNKT